MTLTLIRMLAAACVTRRWPSRILNNRETSLKGEGPVVIVVDNGWGSTRFNERARFRPSTA